MSNRLDLDISKQVEFAKSHSTVVDAQGAVIFRNKKIWVIGYAHLPLKYKYSSEETKQFPEIHITAVMDAIMKIGSYKTSQYADLEFAVSGPIKIGDLALIVEMGFKTLWIKDEKVIPPEYFSQILRSSNIKL